MDGHNVEVVWSAIGTEHLFTVAFITRVLGITAYSTMIEI